MPAVEVAPKLCGALRKDICHRKPWKSECKKDKAEAGCTKIVKQICENLEKKACRPWFCAPDWFPFDQELPSDTVCESWWDQILDCE